MMPRIELQVSSKFSEFEDVTYSNTNYSVLKSEKKVITYMK